MFIDLNLDEFKNTVITKDNSLKKITTDTEYWYIRNYLLNNFYRNQKVFEKYKGIVIRDKFELEKNIEKDISIKLPQDIKNRIKVIVLVLGSKANIMFFYISRRLDEKDKLIFDFDIVL